MLNNTDQFSESVNNYQNFDNLHKKCYISMFRDYHKITPRFTA